MSGPEEVPAGPRSTEFGLCPLMSSTVLVPEQIPDLLTPGGAPQVRLSQIECVTPCFGEKCGMWSSKKKHCSIVSLSEISNDLKDIEVSGGRGYLYSIAETLKSMLKLKIKV